MKSTRKIMVEGIVDLLFNDIARRTMAVISFLSLSHGIYVITGHEPFVHVTFSMFSFMFAIPLAIELAELYDYFKGKVKAYTVK